MRKLLCAAAGFSGACAICVYLLPYGAVLWLALAAATLGCVCLLIKNNTGRRAFLVLLSAALAFLWFWGYSRMTVVPCREYVGQERTVRVRVCAFPKIRGDYSSIEARIIDEDMPKVKILVYDYSAGMDELRPGDELSMDLKILSAETRYGEDSDYYHASGIFLRGNIRGEYSHDGRWGFSWLYFPARFAESIKTQALERFPEDVAPLMKALLTGDKAEYYQDDTLYSAMKAAGFVHIIAVSGMHVAFLVGILMLFTGKGRSVALIGIPVILVFMAMVGFTPSVVRAGIMAIVVMLAPLLGRENDPISSLFFALLIMLVFNPFAVASVSLQLSFAATLGIILLSPGVYRRLMFTDSDEPRFKNKSLNWLMRKVCGWVAASIGAIFFSTPIAVYYFGYFPVYSIPVGVLCLWAMSLAFYLGYDVCLAGLVWAPFGSALGWLVAWLPRYTIAVVKLAAGLPHSTLSIRSLPGLIWLAFAYILFIATYLLRGKGRYRPLVPVCLTIISIAATLLYVDITGSRGEEMCVLDVGQGQSIAVLSESASVIIDCGGSGPNDAGDTAADYLKSKGRDSVDLLILTHLHADHAGGVERLFSRVDVERVAMPIDCGDDEYYDDIIDACVYNGTEIYFIEENSSLSVGSMDFVIYAPIGSGDANERGLIIEGELSGLNFIITGDADSGVERRLAQRYELADADVLVVGHHGSKYSTCAELLDEVKPELAIISVGNNSYGHPTDEVLERLSDRDIEIRRTDKEGNILITAGSHYG